MISISHAHVDYAQNIKVALSWLVTWSSHIWNGEWFIRWLERENNGKEKVLVSSDWPEVSI